MTDYVKVLILTHNFPRHPGDHAGVFISLLARGLPAHGIEPIVMAPHDPGASEDEMIEGIRVLRFRYADSDAGEDIAYRGNMQQLVLGSVTGIFKFKRFLDRWRAAALEAIDRENIDLVAGHWLIPAGNVMKTIARRRPHLPMVLSSHGTDIRLIRKYAGATYRYFRPFCRGLNRWTFVSTFLRDTIRAMDPALKDVIEVLPLPHDEAIFYRDESIRVEPDLAVAVTRFTPQKRVGHLIRAFALVVENRPDARLEIYGTGPLEPEIRRLIEKFGLQENVKLMAPVDQSALRTVYNRAAVVVLNSFQEGFGLALSEAMLCGTAVIGTASGGITDIIAHEKRGLLVPPDNSAALAEAITRLLAEPDLRGRLGAAGHEFARRQYASAPLSKRYAEILRRAAGK